MLLHTTNDNQLMKKWIDSRKFKFKIFKWNYWIMTLCAAYFNLIRFSFNSMEFKLICHEPNYLDEIQQ